MWCDMVLNKIAMYSKHLNLRACLRVFFGRGVSVSMSLSNVYPIPLLVSFLGRGKVFFFVL